MIGFAAALLAALLVFSYRSSSPALLQDTDTRVLLETIRERQAPLSWFGGDWPLENHFYRPISTLVFELDNAIWRENAAGYGATNALLAALCVLLLFWLFRELTDRPGLTAGATLLFVAWTLSMLGTWLGWLYWIALAATVVGVIRHGKAARQWLPVLPFGLFLATELSREVILQGVIAWIPGRTASVMTVFCLVAMAAYARYERLSAQRSPAPERTPLDPPATRNTEVAAKSARLPVAWAVVSCLATALALGSYEQAVMLPACLLGVAICMRWQRYRVRWGWQAGFWLLLVGYLALRYQLVPTEASGYQRQQFRDGPGVWLSLTGYLFPSFFNLQTLQASLSVSWIVLLTSRPWVMALELIGNVQAVLLLKREWVLGLTAYLLSFLAYLPMAWLKPFDHYQYWPVALRSLLGAVLTVAFFRAVVTAVSPPTRQAPPRPAPAPGSLLHL